MNDGVVIEFKKGQVIFNQGDESGYMYFIEEGDVQIFTIQDAQEVELSKMVAGEVIGTLTCITNENRLASARALTDVKLKRISSKKLANLIVKLPKWVNVVLKDFSQRLTFMNQSYSVLRKKISMIQEVNKVYTSAQLASVIATIAQEKQKLFDEVPGLLPEDILEYCSQLLNRPEVEITEIFEVFLSCGLITLKIEQEKKRKFFTVENALKIKDYCHFVQQTNRRKIKRILNTKFKIKELKLMSSLMLYAERLNCSLEQEVAFKVSDLINHLEKETGQKFHIDLLMPAKELEMIQIKGYSPKENIEEHASHIDDADDMESMNSVTVHFTPKQLSHMITHLAIYQKLML